MSIRTACGIPTIRRRGEPSSDCQRYRGFASCSAPATRSGRSAFTLIELLLAAVIGVLLMSALYVALNVQLRHAQAGRDLIEHSLLSRALLTRMAEDIKASMGPSVPVLPSSSTTAAATTSTTGSTSGTGTTSTASSSSTAPVPAPTSGTTSTQLCVGVQGDSQQLVLFLSRLPPTTPQSAERGAQGEKTAVASDWRRVTYWLAGSAGEPLGLARQEIEQVTADSATLETPTGDEESTFIIAEEVKSVEFRYFDGTSWVEQWDGSTLGPDGMTPQGPPLAIAITLGIVRGDSEMRRGQGERPLKYYRHVVAIATAAGTATTTESTPAP